MHDRSRWVGQIADHSGLESGPHPLDRVIAELAGRQHGVVAARQLAALGVTQRATSHRVRRGRLHRLHTGVFAVGHQVLTVRGRWLAAVLACGPQAVLSHASAAELWGLRFGASRWIDVTIPRTGRRTRDPIRVHRPRSLRADEMTIRHAIPVTSAARTPTRATTGPAGSQRPSKGTSPASSSPAATSRSCSARSATTTACRNPA